MTEHPVWFAFILGAVAGALAASISEAAIVPAFWVVALLAYATAKITAAKA